MDSAFTVNVGETYSSMREPFFVTINEIKAAGETINGEPLYEICGGRLYQPAQYADAMATKANALSRASAILFERAEKIRDMAEEYRRRSFEQAEIESEEAAA
jgi:hypothetical protein